MKLRILESVIEYSKIGFELDRYSVYWNKVVKVNNYIIIV